MESLALLAAIILLGTLAAGVASLVVVIRRPQRIAARIIAGTVAVVALAAGLNIALLDIGIGARATGAVTAALGLAALVAAVTGRQPADRSADEGEAQ